MTNIDLGYIVQGLKVILENKGSEEYPPLAQKIPM